MPKADSPVFAPLHSTLGRLLELVRGLAVRLTERAPALKVARMIAWKCMVALEMLIATLWSG